MFDTKFAVVFRCGWSVNRGNKAEDLRRPLFREQLRCPRNRRRSQILRSVCGEILPAFLVPIWRHKPNGFDVFTPDGKAIQAKVAA
jgi:hypothetical protein